MSCIVVYTFLGYGTVVVVVVVDVDILVGVV